VFTDSAVQMSFCVLLVHKVVGICQAGEGVMGSEEELVCWLVGLLVGQSVSQKEQGTRVRTRLYYVEFQDLHYLSTNTCTW
jgi:hypothetical protein